MKVEDPEQALTQAVCSRVREHLSGADAELAEAFARQFYRWVAPEDVAERDPLDLYGLALGTFNFARERPPGTPKVRVYNPHFEEHGWQSTHTAVEIVTDDMPFLIDSISMELNRRGCGVHLIIHPVLSVRRDDAGRLLEILTPGEAPEEGTIGESVVHAEVVRQTDASRLHELERHLERVIGEVRCAVEDWQAMRERKRSRRPPDHAPSEDEEAAAFLDWLAGDNPPSSATAAGDGAGLGILRDSAGEDPDRPGSHVTRAPITLKQGQRALHRPPRRVPDLVGREATAFFLGLYTHTAYRATPTEIPILRRRVARRARASRPSHTAATTRRRCSRSSTPTRATSCSRSRTTSCSTSRWESSTWASASGCACRLPRPCSARSPRCPCRGRRDLVQHREPALHRGRPPGRHRHGAATTTIRRARSELVLCCFIVAT